LPILPPNVQRRSERPGGRGLSYETLEARCLLAATDLAAITGTVYRDFAGDGFDAGEEVAGATMRLYRDDGDNTFDSGVDTLVDTDLTDVGGVYLFDDLVVGTYFVQQPGQTVGAVTLNEDSSGPIDIDAADVAGVQGTVFDTFDTAQTVVANAPVGTTASSSLAAAEAIGGERDLLAEVTMAAGGFDNVEVAAGSSRLSFNPTFDAAGRYLTTWDGPDGDATVLDPTGLVGLFGGPGGLDLTDGGASTHVAMTVGVQTAGTEARIRVYTDATHWSQATVALTATAGQPDAEYYLDYATDFADGAGAVDGADFDNVGAVELEIEATVAAADGRVTLIGAIGPNVVTEDFPNIESADLSLSKIVDDGTPNVGQNVTFTLTLTNGGPDTANNIAVTDTLPAGMTYVSSVIGQGTYDDVSGVWRIGTVANAATATLQITASVDTTGTKTNTAEVTAADQFDPDSTPVNGDTGEDDWAQVSLTPEVADLSITKSVDDPAPDIGQNVTFTIALRNDGPDAATNVAVSDPLPAGMTYVSSSPSQGSYASGTGVWTVGTVANGATASLQITATVDTAGSKTNTAQVSAADQFDPDSTPANDEGGEDDQDTASLTPLGTISGYVFIDVDNDGAREAGEGGIGGVALTLTGMDDLDAAVDLATSTAADGSYAFADLRPSNGAGYTVTQTQPAGYLDGIEEVGSLGGAAAVPSSADVISAIVLASGESGEDYNFGELEPSSLAGSVYYDANEDGVMQPTESGIAGVTLTLTGTDDLGSAVNQADTTAADGSYLFSNLRPSDATGYTLTETQPAGFQDGLEALGTPALGATALDDVFTNLDLDAGIDAVDFDFGELIQLISKRRFLASVQSP